MPFKLLGFKAVEKKKKKKPIFFKLNPLNI